MVVEIDVLKDLVAKNPITVDFADDAASEKTDATRKFGLSPEHGFADNAYIGEAEGPPTGLRRIRSVGTEC